MIYAVSSPYLLMMECFDGLDSDTSSRLLVKLVERAYETAAGALTLIAIGHLREAEILSRTIFESSVTAAYIAKEAPQLRLLQFFHSYIRQEREQNRKWAKEAEKAHADLRRDHAGRIREKNELMDDCERIICRYIEYGGIDPGEATKWVGLIDRLTALDRSLEYRTVYAAMCSQSHHDAEDMLNHFLAISVAGEGDAVERVEREADTFSIFMVLFGLQWFVEATVAVCRHLKFPTVVTEGGISLRRIMAELVAVKEHLDKGEFPEDWLFKHRNSNAFQA